MMATIPFATIVVLDRYDNYLEQLEYERQRISNEPKPWERSYIEPELKAKLEKVELDLREKVRLLHEDLPPSTYAVNLNHQTKEIEVLVENKQLIPKIKDMITEYPDEIKIVVTHGGIYTDLAFWSTDEDYCQEWCDNDELYQMGCDQPILAHITKYSNLLDEEFDGTYSLDWIGLPDGMSKEKLEECVDFIYEKRIGMELTSGKIFTGSYELEDPSCIGGRGMIKNEDCEIIGKYDFTTGMPIVENKEQCDMLEGDWDEEQKICDSKYGGK